MRRVLQWFAWILVGLVGTVAALPALLVFGGNTGPGSAVLARIVSGATGGMVTIASGPIGWPTHLHVDSLDLHDAAGIYLRLHDITLDWSILPLLHAKAEIDALTVGSATLERLPHFAASSGGTSSGPPVTIVLHRLRVDRLALAPAVAGKAYVLRLDGAGTLDSYEAGKGQLTATQIGGAAVYKVDADINARTLDLTVSANEPPHGLIASLAGLPQLGAITIDATLAGPRDAIATHLAVTAGKLDARAQGTLDLIHAAADLTVAAHAPAMQPRPDLSWQSVALDAQLLGAFTKPTVTGHLIIDQLRAWGGGAKRLSADVLGNAGQMRVRAVADAPRVPGPHPDLLAGAPLTLEATAHLAAADRPVDFSLRHKLLTATGSVRTAGTLQAQMHLAIPQLAPFAAVAGAKLQGHTALDLSGSMQAGTTHLAVSGTIGLDAGATPGPALIGSDAHIDSVVDLHGSDITITRFALDGQTASASVHGSVAGGVVNLDWTAALTDLSVLQPTLRGTLRAQGHVGGSAQDLSVAADVSGDVATGGVSAGQITAHIQAWGLPDAPNGQVTAQGTLLGSPVALTVAAQRLADGAYHVAIDRADWKSAHAQGALTVNPPALVPQGQLRFSMTRLADLDPLLGLHLAGSVEAALDATASQATLTAKASNAALPNTAAVSRMTLRLAVANPTTQPVVNADLALDGVSAGTIAGSATLHAQGPKNALALKLAAALPRVDGAAARVEATGLVDVAQRVLRLDTLRADWKQVAVRLRQPARIEPVAGGIRLHDLRLAVDRGALTVSGQVGRTLDLTATLRDLPAGIAAVFDPGLSASGTISGEAHLTGSASRPDGSIRLAARRIQLRGGPGQAMPPAGLTATATLHSGQARLDVRLEVGTSHLQLAGSAPVTGQGVLDLRTTGTVDLAMVDPLLAANGRRVAGRLAVDARITGSARQPRIVGSGTLTGGDVQDYRYGVHLRAIAATIQADGDHLRLTRVTGQAGAGTVSGSGTVGLAAPMPVNLTFTAQDATPISNEILTERLDSQLSIVGDVDGTLTVQGNVQVLHADIRIPETLPRQVAVIPVRDPNAPPQPPRKPALAMNLLLDLTVAAREVFVRGRGLDADLAGTIHVRGSSADPQPNGGLALRRGTFSLAGQTLRFTEGTVDFVGAGVSDPALHFVATTTSNNITATLTIGGTAHEPKITLSSVPELPQDEILAQILFQRSVGSLSPFEVAQVAAAVASFTGVTSGLDPLNSLRKALGLDRLSVGADAAGNPTVQAGRYLAPGIYLGAKQNATGTGTQAELQIDLTKGLKLNTTAGTGATSATGAASSGQGASVGLTYQFEY